MNSHRRNSSRQGGEDQWSHSIQLPHYLILERPTKSVAVIASGVEFGVGFYEPSAPLAWDARNEHVRIPYGEDADDDGDTLVGQTARSIAVTQKCLITGSLKLTFATEQDYLNVRHPSALDGDPEIYRRLYSAIYAMTRNTSWIHFKSGVQEQGEDSPIPQLNSLFAPFQQYFLPLDFRPTSESPEGVRIVNSHLPEIRSGAARQQVSALEASVDACLLSGAEQANALEFAFGDDQMALPWQIWSDAFARHVHDPRRSAIDAASAAEVALDSCIDWRQSQVESPELDFILRRKLSGIYTKYEVADLFCEMRPTLNDVAQSVAAVRNKAAHNGQDPTLHQVVKSVDVAGQLVADLVTLSPRLNPDRPSVKPGR